MSDEHASQDLHIDSTPQQALDRRSLRQSMRKQRKSVPKATRVAVTQAINRHLVRQILVKGQRIAVYAAFDGEIDLSRMIRHAQRVGCIVYAPRITNLRARRMEFIELPKQGSRQCNRLAILEPRHHLNRRIDPRLLDVVLLPVVAFDMHGWRLGFGAGFYDRKFGFMRRPFRPKPLLIGVGYEFQRVPPQIPNTWDVLLDALVSERGIRRLRAQYINGSTLGNSVGDLPN